MNCTECQENLSAYIEDELDPGMRNKIADHLNSCPTCRAENQSLAGTHQWVSEHLMIQAPEALWYRIETRIKAVNAQAVASVSQSLRPAPLSWLAELWGFSPARVWVGALAILFLAGGLIIFTRGQLENRRLDQLIQIYMQERDAIEQAHTQPAPSGGLATDEYDDNPFVLEDRHSPENPFKL